MATTPSAPLGPRAANYLHKPATVPTSSVDDKRNATLLRGLQGLCCCSKQQRHTVAKRLKKVSAFQLFVLARRVAIVTAAIRYLWVSFDASIASINVLTGVRNAPMAFQAYNTQYILSHLGETTVADSPFVLQTLGNDTSPRAYTYFLEADGVVSTTECATPKFHSKVYSTRFLGLAIAFVMRDTYTNVTEFATHEVVAGVVDCSFPPIISGDATLVRVYYVMRNRVTHGDILLASVRFSMEDYKIPEQNERGPIGFSSFDFVRDLRATVPYTVLAGMLGYPFESPVSVLYTHVGYDPQGWRSLTTLRKDPRKEPPTTVFAVRRTGFYISSDSEQANIKHQYWTTNDLPKVTLSEWNWKGEPVLKDSWAWVHLFHVGFALDVVFNLSVLFLVVYRNLQDGKIWLGDAFVSISSTLLMRGVVIIVSWVINGFWSLMEFCLHDAHKLAGTQEIYFHPQILQADLLTIFLAACTVAGYVCRERIDPAFAIIVFEIFFALRLEIAKVVPSLRAAIVAFAETDHSAAVLGVSDTIAASIPMRQWTTHTLPHGKLKFALCCLAGLATSGFVVFVYILLRKIWSHFHHEKVTKLDSKNATAKSGGESTVLTTKRTLTLFEIATGAELQSRFGVISDYENCIFIKGMKYASADGIYSNGFVIVGGKYVVSSSDLLSIALMKILRVSLRVYAYELKGSTVQQTARLVEHDTFTWSELTHLNVTVLS